MRISLSTAIVLIVVFFCFLRRVNLQPRDLSYSYDQKFSVQDSLLSVGYAAKCIIPEQPIRMVGYGWREEFQGVHDSIYVRAILLTSGGKKVALLSYDLMLVPPELAQKVKQRLYNQNIDEVYISATHTHSSFGGFGTTPVGRIILGNYNEDLINFIVDKSEESIRKCIQNQQKTTAIEYSKNLISKIKNRVTDERNVNDYLRKLKFKTENGNYVSLFTSNVHPTIISHDQVKLSNDYPGEICKQDTSTFSMFMAGIMGNLTPIVHQGKDAFERAEKFAQYHLKAKQHSSTKIKTGNFSYAEVRLLSLSYGAHFIENFKLRNWAFEWLIGRSQARISVFRIGNLLLVGLPVELSAKYYLNLEDYAAQNDLQLLLTTFNGEYLGYATPPEQYKIRHMETREMNWIGKFGGDNFEEVIQKIIEKQ